MKDKWRKNENISFPLAKGCSSMLQTVYLTSYIWFINDGEVMFLKLGPGSGGIGKFVPFLVNLGVFTIVVDYYWNGVDSYRL